MQMNSSNFEMQRCIEASQHCHNVCLQMAMTHCLQRGGLHVEPMHFRLMLNCADVCATAADLMLSESPFARKFCAGLCADICDACAENCAPLGDMDDCVQACRQCAQECRTIAAMGDDRGATTGATTAGAERKAAQDTDPQRPQDDSNEMVNDLA